MVKSFLYRQEGAGSAIQECGFIVIGFGERQDHREPLAFMSLTLFSSRP